MEDNSCERERGTNVLIYAGDTLLLSEFSDRLAFLPRRGDMIDICNPPSIAKTRYKVTGVIHDYDAYLYHKEIEIMVELI